jgi:hypothetical protein
MAVAHAGTRALIGLTLLVAPGRWRGWFGDVVDDGGGRVALQALGIREVVIGTGILHSLARRRPVRAWFGLGVLLEVVDSGSTLSNRRALPGGPGPDGLAAFGVSGAIGGALLAALLED